MKNKRAAIICMSAILTVSGGTVSGITAHAESGNQAAGMVLASPILITEVVPNTDNLSGSDAWEYYEITNVSSQDINLNDYNVIYDNGSKKTIWTAEGVDTLPAGKTMLVWVRNGCNEDKTVADFQNYYQTKTGQAMPSDGLIASVHSDGLANSGTRSMYIQTKTGKTLSTISYNAKDSANGKIDVDEAIIFQHSGDGETTVYDQAPTPFVLSENNVSGTYELPAQVADPFVEVSGASTVSESGNLELTVSGSNLDLTRIINGNIQVDGGKSYPLTYDADGNLKGTIPGNDVKDISGQRFSYTVSVSDGINTAVSSAKEVRVISEQVDLSKTPALAITEILPDSSNVNGADAYEFIEVYNNSDRDIDLKDYKLCYYYPSDNSNTVWWESDDSKILKSGETVVFWVKNGANDSLTKKDFNDKFGTDLTDDQLIEISCGGMANGSARGIRLVSNVMDDIDFVSYNMTDGVDDTTPDKSITYQNQYKDGSFQSVMTSNHADPTPGKVVADEKPDCQAKLTVPTDAPAYEDLSDTAFDNLTETLKFDLKADSVETTVKTVKLYLKYNDQADYTCYNLNRSDVDHFAYSMGNIDILNKASFTYYFTVSDGFQTVQTPVKTLTNADSTQDNAFNLSDQETLAGSREIIANGQKLLIDGQDVSGQSVKSLNGVGKIAFDTSQTDVFFKNAVAVGNKVIGVFNEGTYDQWRTYTYDVAADLYDAQTGTITVAFHAGNKANVLEHNIENNDDFLLKNVRMIMPDGETLYPVSYGAKIGLGSVEHDNLDNEPTKDVTSEVTSQDKQLKMGDSTGKYEILYVTFQVPQKEFSAIRYLWNTKDATDGTHTISNGSKEISVQVDNTAPEISTNIEDGKLYHKETITADAKDTGSGNVKLSATLDGKNITLPYEFRALTMTPGDHTLELTASDSMGNTSRKIVTFKTPKESADLDENVTPANGSTTDANPVLGVTPTDEAGDDMTVTFKKGEHYTLADSNEISKSSGVSDTSGTEGEAFAADSGNGFPYEAFDIQVADGTDENTVVQAKWSGTSNSAKTFMYAYNVSDGKWEKLSAEKTEDGDSLVLTGSVTVKDHLKDGKIRIMVQNGEGYTPAQYADTGAAKENVDETDRSAYDFTFAVESDTQYYNEDYPGNPDQSVDGKYQYQLDIHNWVLKNRQRMNIQYMFHDGDIIDDEPNEKEWQQADEAYKLLDQAGFAYGVLAGNHDVGHLSGDYSNYGKYFGEDRYNSNPWYGGSYQNNRCHYDLITVDGIDFLMMYTGWGVNQDEIDWMNQVLAQYPERKAILNFHEYLLASGGMGEDPQKVYDQVVSQNENVCMVLSGHYHNAFTRVDTFTNADGSTRKVYNMLFDYQSLPEGGMGYMRLMHFDTTNGKIIVRTYSPSLDDYDAKASANPNEGNNKYVAPNANINGEEDFEIPFADLGITPETKKLETSGLDVNVYGTETIGTVEYAVSGQQAQYTWNNAPEGLHGWYAEVTDANGGLSRTGVQYLTVVYDKTAPVLNVPSNTEIFVGDAFNPYDGVTATDDRDGDLTASIILESGSVDTGKAGIYELTYSVTDQAGNRTEVKRTVTVKEKENAGTGDEGGNSGSEGTGGNSGNTGSTGNAGSGNTPETGSNTGAAGNAGSGNTPGTGSNTGATGNVGTGNNGNNTGSTGNGGTGNSTGTNGNTGNGSVTGNNGSASQAGTKNTSDSGKKVGQTVKGVKTGDQTPVMATIVAMFGALGASMVALLKRKKQ